MNTLHCYPDFDAAIRELNFQSSNCIAQITELRCSLQAAQSDGSLTLHQWRVLWEEVSLIQARCALLRPDAWRYVSAYSTDRILPVPIDNIAGNQ